MTQSHFSPAARVHVLLVGLGAVGGAVAAIPLTVIGTLVSGDVPARLPEYLWNMGVFGSLGAVFGPTLGWSALRRVPLWRAVSEPVGGAVIGAAVGALVGSGLGFLLLAPVGVGVAVWRLNRAHREPGMAALPSSDSGA